ncbi:MAG: TolB family protein, partial [Candidatus Zixiibacteriota bacterium]
MAQPFDEASLELAGEAVPIAENVSFLRDWNRGVFSASPSGQLIYRVGEVNTGSDLLIVDREGKPLDSVGEQLPRRGPRISRDGNFISVDVTDQASSNTDIWIYDLTRSGMRRRFTFGSGLERAAIWSPDDSQIIYTSVDKGISGIYAKSVGGADSARLLYESTFGLWPSDWSTDGRFVALSHDENDDIWILPVQSGGEPFSYLKTTFAESTPTFSPDGRWLAYTSDESGKLEVYVAPFPNYTGKWQVSTNDGDRPRWSKDGKKIYYLSNQDSIMVAEVDGSESSFKVGRVQSLFKVNNAMRPGRIYDVFPDEQRFLINVNPVMQSKSFIQKSSSVVL